MNDHGDPTRRDNFSDGLAADPMLLPEMVVVSVGTDHHPFDRLIEWTARWAAEHPAVKVVVQRGTAAAPTHLETHELIPHDELRELFGGATVVVSHGGPSTVMDARMAGKYPVVVPRDPARGEHVDEHQIRFAHHLARHELAHLALNEAEFRTALDAGLDDPRLFSIPRQDSAATTGVVRFGQVVDELLGIATTLKMSDLDPVEQRQTERRGDDRRDSHGDQSSAEQPSAEQPSAEQPSAEQPSAEQPSADQNRAVSTVIATRDRPVLLRRAIDAVLSQDLPYPIEVVVVFDHSEPDETLASVSQSADGFERRVVVTSNARKPGLAGARNTGVAAASYDWIAFCDDDDEWLAGKLVAQFEAVDRLPGARVATTGVFINFQDEDTPRIPDQEKLTFEGFLIDRMTEVHPSATLVARSAIEDIGDVDEAIPGGYAEDYDWLLRAAKVSAIAVAPRPLVRIYWHGASFFFERWKTIDDALDYLIEKHPEFHQHPAGLARIRGQQAVARGAMKHRGLALRTAWETFRLHPLERRVPVAIVVAAGVPAGFVLKTLHRLGRGI